MRRYRRRRGFLPRAPPLAPTGAAKRARRCYADDVVTVLYFAAAREKAGLSSERLALPPDASVAELLAAVQARHPALTEVLPRCRVAIDQSFAAADARVPEGAEVALIPPVAGG